MNTGECRELHRKQVGVGRSAEIGVDLLHRPGNPLPFGRAHHSARSIRKNVVISPSTTFTYLVISVVIFIALYLCLAALFLVFMLRYSRREPDPDPSLAPAAGEPDTRVPSMLY